MILRCGVRNDEESVTNPMFVCHHCGMPVCENHGMVVSADDAFAEGLWPVSRAAMHCPECAEEKHKGAAKHHRWADPSVAQAPGVVPAGQIRPPAPQGQAGSAD